MDKCGHLKKSAKKMKLLVATNDLKFKLKGTPIISKVIASSRRDVLCRMPGYRPTNPGSYNEIWYLYY